jgi:uncharacterized protein (DUF58 family)
MRLALAPPGIVAAALAGLLLGFGLLAASPTLLFLAACAALPILVDAVLGVGSPEHFRAGDLRLGWQLAGPAREHVVGRAVRIGVTIRNPSRLTLAIDRADVFASPRVAPDRRSLRLPTLPPDAEARHTIRVLPLAPGKLVLHGLLIWISTPLGFFRHRLYFPTPLRLRVLPRGFTVRLAGPRRAASEVRGPMPRLRARILAGDDPDLREIRDHHLGDPFRRIAWRPSARAGKLLTKEYERHLPRRHLVAVEASAATLRRVGGRAPLDALAGEAYAIALAAVRAGDSVGLATFDGRLLRLVPPAAGRAAARAVLEGLLDAYQPVDDDTTDVTADELVQVVGRYLLLHERIDTRVRVAGRGTFHDAAAVDAAVSGLGVSLEAAARDVRGEDAGDVRLRRFCLDRGIELPVQERYAVHARAEGVRQVLAAAATPGARSQQVHVLTDVDAVEAWATLAGDLNRLRRNRVAVRCVLPPRAPRGRDPLHAVDAMVRRARHRRLARYLRRVGVELAVTTAPEGFGLRRDAVVPSSGQPRDSVV